MNLMPTASPSAYCVYTAGVASAEWSPGGIGTVTTFGERVIHQQDQQLRRTSAKEAALIAVREALTTIPIGCEVDIVTNRGFVRKVMQREQQLRKPELVAVQQAIFQLSEWRHLQPHIISSHVDAMKHLKMAHQLATEAAERAWRSSNSPACPRCQSRMVVRNGRSGEFWGCERYPDCRGTVEMYRDQR